jgi:tRNA dimethylallyltransferase
VLVPLVAVVGPTAAGKSGLGVRLAQVLGGEVVNADSMQLYKGMDIGTAKLPLDERAGVPHHLLDVWDVTTTADVATYQSLAREAVDDIRARGRVPVVVGGSGLYVSAVVDDLDFPGTEPALRAELEAELAEVGPRAMHVRLAALDPEAADAIEPANGRRIVRALEVVALRGRFVARLPRPQAHQPTVLLGLDVPRTELDERIEQRVNRMWACGLVEEVTRLAASGLRDGRTASRALGYAQVLRHLDGELSEEAAREETVRATRRFARRQLSWFRRDERTHWLTHDSPELLDQALAYIA